MTFMVTLQTWAQKSPTGNSALPVGLCVLGNAPLGRRAFKVGVISGALFGTAAVWLANPIAMLELILGVPRAEVKPGTPRPAAAEAIRTENPRGSDRNLVGQRATATMREVCKEHTMPRSELPR